MWQNQDNNDIIVIITIHLIQLLTKYSFYFKSLFSKRNISIVILIFCNWHISWFKISKAMIEEYITYLLWFLLYHYKVHYTHLIWQWCQNMYNRSIFLKYHLKSHLIHNWHYYRQTIFNQLDIMVSYVDIIGLCHVMWQRFHFKRMLITGLFSMAIVPYKSINVFAIILSFFYFFSLFKNRWPHLLLWIIIFTSRFGLGLGKYITIKIGFFIYD